MSFQAFMLLVLSFAVTATARQPDELERQARAFEDRLTARLIREGGDGSHEEYSSLHNRWVQVESDSRRLLGDIRMSVSFRWDTLNANHFRILGEGLQRVIERVHREAQADRPNVNARDVDEMIQFFEQVHHDGRVGREMRARVAAHLASLRELKTRLSPQTPGIQVVPGGELRSAHGTLR